MKQDTILFFCGKNMPIKRYQPYFPHVKLVTLPSPPSDVDDHPIVLCHSLGIVKAVEYCREYPKTKIVCLDGVCLDAYDAEDTKSVLKRTIIFRPIEKKGRPDEHLYARVVYYNLPESIRHYPYMNKHIRDKILKELV